MSPSNDIQILIFGVKIQTSSAEKRDFLGDFETLFVCGFVILSKVLVAFKSQLYFLFIRPLHHHQHQLQMLKTNYRI